MNDDNLAINLIVRLLITQWVIAIAVRKNRSAGKWAILAFVMPVIALVAVYFSKAQPPKAEA